MIKSQMEKNNIWFKPNGIWGWDRVRMMRQIRIAWKLWENHRKTYTISHLNFHMQFTFCYCKWEQLFLTNFGVLFTLHFSFNISPIFLTYHERSRCHKLFHSLTGPLSIGLFWVFLYIWFRFYTWFVIISYPSSQNEL